MRVGQFSDSFYPIVDGVGRVVYNYARSLTARGDECYVVAPMVDTGYRGGFPFDLIDFYGMSVPGSPQYRAGVAALDRHYSERIEHVTLDIAHAHTPFFAGQEALRLAAKHDVPLVGTFHSKYYDDFYKATHAELLATIGVKFVVEFYEHCDEVWAVSEASADVLRDYGYTGDIVVMENGTEMRERCAEDKRRAMETFHISAKRPVLLYVGQLNWKKNILRILEAAAILKRKGDAVTVLLVGQGPDAEAIRKKAEELGIADETVFTGHVMDTSLLDGLYQCATLFTFPSVYDTFSLVLREAAVMGTPAVLARGSCAAESIEDGVNGLICDDSGESLAEVIGKCMYDKEKLAALGENACATIPVAWESVMSKVRERYLDLIERSNTTEMRKQHSLLRSAFIKRVESMYRARENEVEAIMKCYGVNVGKKER